MFSPLALSSVTSTLLTAVTIPLHSSSSLPTEQPPPPTYLTQRRRPPSTSSMVRSAENPQGEPMSDDQPMSMTTIGPIEADGDFMDNDFADDGLDSFPLVSSPPSPPPMLITLKVRRWLTESPIARQLEQEIPAEVVFFPQSGPHAFPEDHDIADADYHGQRGSSGCRGEGLNGDEARRLCPKGNRLQPSPESMP